MIQNHDLLAGDTSMGAVTLRVADLDAMIAYYRDGVTLELLEQVGDVAVLGRGERPIMRLQHSPQLRGAGPREAGLFHTAIVFDNQEALLPQFIESRTLSPGRSQAAQTIS